ncbi:MAG: carbamoyltransferase HypF [Syntrophobacteraceae bacterium]|nr:carbamoyltransferase HypF [Syntrophobacteraceae bacterium]
MSDTTVDGHRRVLIHIHGIVQGVGFRPYVFQLAHAHGLGGWVRNQSNGVEIEVSGPTPRVEGFLHDMPLKVPPLARIVDIRIQDLPFAGKERFHILESRVRESRSTLIAPDVCTCPECLEELFDPENRRYRYPFINCTNCGPRYTIIRDIPYDREKTTMSRFAMCPECSREYQDPRNRRFHAQPNACWACGPRTRLLRADGSRPVEGDEAVRRAVELLEEGAIVAVKGLGGFHLAVRADGEEAVERLRRRKIREEKPFAVMFSDLEAVRDHCEMGEDEERLLCCAARPILLLNRRPENPPPRIAPAVAPKNRALGSFLPYTPLHHLLFHGSSYRALVMTSGNQSDEPIVTDNEEALVRLRDIADFFLLHDRDIHMRCDDSVTRVLFHKPRPIRRARGYVPVPVFLKDSMPAVLGVGAELKSTVCLTRNREAFLSQHIGDLENLETFRAFERTIDHLERILEIEPEYIVHDMHPDYLSTQWALSQDHLPRLAVQHHHAHIASVIAEHRLSGPVLGLAMDGTGYGPDGTIWGGEVLLVEDDRYERLGHFRYLPLPGGGKAIREPWRMAVSALWCLDPGILEGAAMDLWPRWPQDKLKILLQMVRNGIHSPLTSSCGRVFDAVSALIGLRDTVTYEGQAAIELEQAIEIEDGAYEGEVRTEGNQRILDPLPMVSEVVHDLKRDVSRGKISARFHNGLVNLLADAARDLAAEKCLQRVALSGGVFQNAYLLERLVGRLRRQGFEVFVPEEVPPNDACIALGQAYLGACRLMGREKGTF